MAWTNMATKANGVVIDQGDWNQIVNNFSSIGGADGLTHAGPWNCTGSVSVGGIVSFSTVRADQIYFVADKYMGATGGASAGAMQIYCGAHAAAALEVSAGGAGVSWNNSGLIPNINGLLGLGASAWRWSSVWCTAGAFNSSSVAEKEHFTLLDPQDALDAVLGTEFYSFEYGVMPGYWQVGFLAEQAHPLLTDGASVNAQSTASVALAALQAVANQMDVLASRVAQLEAAR